MKLNTLVTCPADTKLFVDLVASACFVRDHHPEFTLDVLVDGRAIPRWWKAPGAWLRTLTDLSSTNPPYTLIIQTTPDQGLAVQLVGVAGENRAGVVAEPNLHIQGRWAQTFAAILGCHRFSPFTPFDLFNHIFIGRTIVDLTTKTNNTKGLWIVDLDTFADHNKVWAEGVLTQLSLTHPGLVRDKIPTAVSPGEVSAYIGGNAAAASWFSYFGAHAAFITTGPWQSKLAPAGAQAWTIDGNQLPDLKVLLRLFQGEDQRLGLHFRHTTEYLGGLLPTFSDEPIDDAHQVYDRLHYVVINYLNDLLEVDLPVPAVTAQCCMRLKGIQTVLNKLIHLNQFGIKFLQEFNDKHKQGNAKEADVVELTAKMAEIDEITNKSMGVYAELDLIKLWTHFSKAGAQGENVVDISKSLILIYYEINQALEAYVELSGSIVQRHGRSQETTTP